ncbi:MAG: SGNH/GDSL hydrolase family protein [Rhodobacteraceae bacterium]|nr:MAG: SGNH/GDSL hydrolase family protein [Paracoccaceae bacterium]
MVRLSDIALAPLHAAQMLGVIARVPRLPEAAGARAGSCGQGQALRLLVLGDSSAAGVGVAHQDQALVGQICVHLGRMHHLDWQLCARSGATTAGALRLLAAARAPVDVVVLALGVNDVLRQTPLRRFAAGQAALIDQLRAEYGARLILASAVPPLGAFEVFPMPLRAHLGRRADALDAELQRVCAARDGVVHVPFDLDPAPHWLAADGLHPGAALYAEWGQRMAGLASRGVS